MRVQKSNSGEGDSQPFLSGAKVFLEEIPFLQLYNVGLMIGGFWLFSFFVSIGRLPNFDLTAGITTLLSVALAGAFIVSLMVGYFLIPSFFLSQIKPSLELKKEDKWYLFFMLNVILFLAGLVIFFLLFAKLDTSATKEFAYCTATPIALIVLIVSFILCRLKFKEPRTKLINYLFSCLKLCVLWFFVLLFSLLLLSAPISEAFLGRDWIFLLQPLMFVLLVVIVNIGVSQAGEVGSTTWLKIVVVGAFIILLSLFNFSGAKGSLLEAPFRMLGLGDIKSVNLVVKKDICNQVNLLIEKSCVIKEDAGIISKVNIISRLGSEYLLDLTSEQTKTNNIVVIRNDDVLLWVRNQPAKKND